MTAHTTLRIDFDSGHRLGPGKVDLLEAIARTGSISAAGREYGMSYRRAWLLIQELNLMAGEPVVTTQEGGRNGGGSVLTACGERIVRLYRTAERRSTEAAAAELAEIDGLLGKAGPA